MSLCFSCSTVYPRAISVSFDPSRLSHLSSWLIGRPIGRLRLRSLWLSLRSDVSCSSYMRAPACFFVLSLSFESIVCFVIALDTVRLINRSPRCSLCVPLMHSLYFPLSVPLYILYISQSFSPFVGVFSYFHRSVWLCIPHPFLLLACPLALGLTPLA